MEAVRTSMKITPVEVSRISEVDFDNIPFGRVFSDHMLLANYADGAWQDAEIRPYGNLSFAPSITALHYGQAIFEGLKAYKSPEGQALIFRPEENFKRMNLSAIRMCMPEIPREIFMDGLQELINMDQQWIPEQEGSSLYIRPVYFATDEYVGIKASDHYKFIIFSSPVGSYYSDPVNLYVTREFVRASKGGTGEAKCAGNYAASLLGAKQAKDRGYHNVLWLDAVEQKYIEECGTMNVFFVIDGVAVTPQFTGSILRGITRHSVITLLQEMNVPVEERMITIDEVVEAHRNGKLEECFGAGTAATIAHVNKIGYEGEDVVMPPVEERKVGPALLKRLNDIRTGKVEDPYGWVTRI